MNGSDEWFATESAVRTWDPMKDNTLNPYWHNGKVETENLSGDDSRVLMDRAIPFIRKAAAEKRPFFAVIWFHAPHGPVVAGPEFLKMYPGRDEGEQNYYGCITALDVQVGRLRKELRDLGVADNTMLWFASDNGPEGDTGDSGASRGSAGPFRGRKRSLWEGGIHVPGLLEWPARIKAGTTTAIPCSGLDYFPTVLDILGFKMKGQPEPLDGVSLVPLLGGRMKERPVPIPFETLGGIGTKTSRGSPRMALVDNRYKLLTDMEGPGDKDLLFDLLADRSETTNVAAKHPQITQSMKDILVQFRESCKRSLAGKDYSVPLVPDKDDVHPSVRGEIREERGKARADKRPPCRSFNRQSRLANSVEPARSTFMHRLVTCLLCLLALPTASFADTVLFEDFESPPAYRQRWGAHPSWSLVQEEIHGKKSTVLNVNGGDVGFGAAVFNFVNFDYEADFRIVKGYGGIVFRAQDHGNLYMMQFGPTHWCPHTLKNGAWNYERIQLPSPIAAGQWIYVKFEVRGNIFKCYVGETADQAKLVGQWEGKEPFADGHIGFRCAAGERLQVDNLRVSTREPLMAHLMVSPSSPPRMLFAGQPIDIKVEVRNTGWKAAKDVHTTLSLPQGSGIAQGEPVQSCGELEPGFARTFSWKVRAEQAGEGGAEIRVQHAGQAQPQKIQLGLAVQDALPPPPASAPAGAAVEVDGRKNLVLANQHVRLVLAKSSKGYSAAVLYVYDGKQWRQVAVSQPIGHLAYKTARGQAVEKDLAPAEYEILPAAGQAAQVRLKGTETDEDGSRWGFTFTYRLDSGGKTVQADYRACADKDRELLYFQGPDLYAGEGSFGAKKRQAVFGGTEWLEASERSSSDRDMVPAIAHRYAPHPYKICMPVMAVAEEDALVALMWDPLDTWDGEHHTLSARFASPNWKDGQDNHLMGLFLPSIPQYVPENMDRAAKAYPLKAGKEIRLRAWIVAEAGGRLMNVVDQYLAAFGPLKKMTLPEDYDAILSKCRVGYMETMWDAKVVGTKHWDGGAAQQFPNACAVLWQDAVWSSDPEVKHKEKERVKLIVSKALEKKGPAGLVDPIDTRAFGTLPCHIRGYFLPLCIGHLEPGLAAWKERIEKECLATQRPDGSWAVVGVASCRQGEEIVSGTVAELAGSVLMYARVTGDQRALKAGLKALEVLDKLPVPRGAQVWECPKYTPDILASGHALWAYLEAYQVTGDRKYLEQARYWGKTVTPFVYLWQAPDVKLMQYCTIAVFGTTHYTHSWFGNPVQWCGLVPGYWLIRLSEFDPSYPWKELGQGIVDNGIRQMLNLWPAKPGVYTDSLGMIDRHVCSCRFEPESLMKPILLARRQGVEVSTRIVDTPGRKIHVSTAARLKAATYDAANRTLSWEIEYPKDEVSYAVIAGITPAALRKDGKVLAQVADLDAAEEGWKLNGDGLLLAKWKHSQLAVRLEATQP